MSRLLFLNLPVADLTGSRAFFDRLGFEFDERFCEKGAAGFMYQRSFHDLDGHLWEVMWIDQIANSDRYPSAAA